MKKIYNESNKILEEEKWERLPRQHKTPEEKATFHTSEQWQRQLQTRGDTRKAKSLNTNSKAYRPDEDVTAG